MLDHPHPIQPRALRSKGVLPASTRVPRLWPNLPVQVQNQLAKQIAQLLWCESRSNNPSLKRPICSGGPE